MRTRDNPAQELDRLRAENEELKKQIKGGEQHKLDNVRLLTHLKECESELILQRGRLDEEVEKRKNVEKVVVKCQNVLVREIDERTRIEKDRQKERCNFEAELTKLTDKLKSVEQSLEVEVCNRKHFEETHVQTRLQQEHRSLESKRNVLAIEKRQLAEERDRKRREIEIAFGVRRKEEYENASRIVEAVEKNNEEMAENTECGEM
jgi:hypothetical protein